MPVVRLQNALKSSRSKLVPMLAGVRQLMHSHKFEQGNSEAEYIGFGEVGELLLQPTQQLLREVLRIPFCQLFTLAVLCNSAEPKITQLVLSTK